MNCFILLAFCVFAAAASPLLDDQIFSDKNDFGKMVEIPDGFGGLKTVDLRAESEHIPHNVAEEVRFLLFTRNNPTTAQILQFNDMDTVRSSNFVANRKTVFLAHGWGGSGGGGTASGLRNAYLASHDCNVISIDWSIGAGSNNYITARNQVMPTGAHVAVFVNNLQAAGFFSFLQVTCVGFSLGAHVCGFLGKHTNQLIANVFGLDPAGPLFPVGNSSARLDSSDAHYVEICHTDIAVLGIADPIGHVDYYPNGGRNQPGCDSIIDANCDHSTAPRIHADTLLNPGMVWGRQCASIADKVPNNCFGPGAAMGIHHPQNQGNAPRGIFRMATNINPPLGQGPF